MSATNLVHPTTLWISIIFSHWGNWHSIKISTLQNTTHLTKEGKFTFIETALFGKPWLAYYTQLLSNLVLCLVLSPFIDEETEIWGTYVACPKSQS